MFTAYDTEDTAREREREDTERVARADDEHHTQPGHLSDFRRESR